MTRMLAVTLCLALAPGMAVAMTWEQRGDAAWSRRADGFLADGEVPPRPAHEAVEAYWRALEQDPDNARLRFKLIEAVYFEGYFVLDDTKARKQAFSRLVDLAEEAVDRAGGPDAAEAHFWAAIAWGLWGMSHSYLTCARRGVAGKIRDHAEAIRTVDEDFADGAGARLLGRLHAATPRIPLFTGWIDRRRGLELLERAWQISTAEPRNGLFLAEALLDLAPDRHGEAIALLRNVCSREPRADYLVEQTEIISEACAVLEDQEGPTEVTRGAAR